MPRPPNVLRPTSLHLMLPEDIRAKLDLHLYSSVEKRVPLGAYQRFFLDLIQEWFLRGSIQTSKDVLSEIYHGLELIYSASSHPDVNRDEALRRIARWSREYADKLLQESK